jgi:hypothetical protein
MSEPGNQLRSWKDIAAFFGVHERTVMRWEESRRLPVHRVGGRERDAVFANVAELEAWVAAGKNRRADEAASRNDGDSEPNGHESSHDDRNPQPNGEVPGVAEPSAVGVPSVAARGRSRTRQTVVVAGGLALIGIVMAVALEVRGRSRAAETGPGSAALASKATPAVVPSAPTGGASVVVLEVSAPGGSAVELAVPVGVSARIGGGANRPAILVTARLEDATLHLEIRRADGQPVKPGGSPGQPANVLLQRGVSVRVLTPYPFDVEWVRTEVLNPQR